MAAVAAAMVVLAGCGRDKDAVLLVTVTAAGSPEGIVALEVTISGPAGPDPETYQRDDHQPLSFPITLTAILPARATGAITIDIRASDIAATTVATGHEGPFPVRAGARETVYVQLDCGGGPCGADGGTGGGDDGGMPTGTARCGNGRVDPNETCDIAIARGDPGACPPADCSDGIPCTKDVVIGSACTARCDHPEMSDKIPGDGCCPAMATRDDDPDCSATCGNGEVDPGETCDKGIAAGSPGACPKRSDCVTGNPCLTDALSSEGTCSAVCLHDPITLRSGPATTDGCCPVGGINTLDGDCPLVCGDGINETGEPCDVGIPAGEVGACPKSCSNMDDSIFYLAGAGCQASCVTPFKIVGNVSGDGYCRPDAGITHAIDTDCPIECGNGRLEPGEACDPSAVGFGACPDSCPELPLKWCLVATLREGTNACDVRCTITAITACVSGDGCCPSGCTNALGANPNDDEDCSDRCGDGILQVTKGEVCDTAASPGHGSCPTQCTSTKPCEEARLVNAGTCAAACVLFPITAPRAGDGCCPNGADFTIDPDCEPLCGNGVVESPAERCDRSAGPASCPTDCPSIGQCTPVQRLGDEGDCSARCVATPITGCASGDQCCPPGCTVATDSDCMVICGDGVVSGAETCDRGITAGKLGSCPGTCDDADACTVDIADGSVQACSRTCSHPRITACRAGDGCCPTWCAPATDADCIASCGDRRVGMGETCDPPASCPTTCPDDGDPCTLDHLIGDPQLCNSACRHTPITACSRAAADRCCPTGCTAADDSDC